MADFTLTLIDIRRVQHYLFNANELKQNLGASELVEQATRQWVFASLPPGHNWLDPGRDRFDEARPIENPDVPAEVIFSGGGNVAIIFRTHSQAIDFTTRYTLQLLENAPGLEAAVGHTHLQWEKPNGLKEAWRRLQSEVMPGRKNGRTISQAMGGLSVTAECAYTGQPAVDLEVDSDSGRDLLISAEVQAKQDAAASANTRLGNILAAENFQYPSRFDELGGEHGRSSYIAVVHADGNSMSTRIKEFTQDADNRKMAAKMRAFSISVNQAGQAAIQAVRDWVCRAPDLNLDDCWVIQNTVGKRDELFVRLVDNYLPVRPIVFGGDDITFVCEGRLGLALAARCLEAAAQQNLVDGNPLYACAGVAIVHAHYPFARAYALAEELCQAAKREARKLDPGACRASLIHWYITSSGLTEDWDALEGRNYLRPTGSLLLRPLIVVHAPQVQVDAWRTWPAWLEQVRAFRSPPWSGRRNKLEELSLALHKTPADVSRFTAIYGLLPKVNTPDSTEAQMSGWHADRCLYSDALETDDWLIYPQRGEG
jgi:hypothetical protein